MVDFAFAVKVTPFKVLKLRPLGWRQLAAVCLDLLDQQAKDGVDARGGPLRSPAGRPVDLHDTNRLFRDVDALLSESKVTLRFNAPYAKTVDDLYRFAGLSPRYRAEFDKLATPIINRQLYAEV